MNYRSPLHGQIITCGLSILSSTIYGLEAFLVENMSAMLVAIPISLTTHLAEQT